MKSIVIVTTLANSPMLNRCIRSILDSDYIGDIVVTSCNPEVDPITELHPRVKFSYQPGDGINNPSWGLVGNCIMSLDKSYHDLVISHDDIIFPNEWYNTLSSAWDIADGHAWSISLPHVEHINVNAPLYLDYLYNNKYTDIMNKFKSNESLFPAVVNAPDQLLGLGIDSWDTNRGIRAIGRWSPVFSLLHNVYTDAVNNYGGENIWVMELLMLHAMVYDKKWCMWVNSNPLIHDRYSDRYDGHNDGGEGHAECYRKFHSIFKYNLEHLLTIWSCLSVLEHKDEIIDAFNSGRFNDIEYIFDEIITLLDNRDCKACKGLSICRCRGAINSIGWGQ